MMQLRWPIASIYLLLCCSTVFAVTVGVQSSRSTSRHHEVDWSRQSKASSSKHHLVLPEVHDSEDLLETLLEKTDGEGHLAHQYPHATPHLSSPESHQEFTQWMETAFTEGFDKHLTGQQSHHPSTNFASSSKPSSSVRLSTIANPSGQFSPNPMAPGHYKSRTKSKLLESRNKTYTSKDLEKEKAYRWHLPYNRLQQKRLRTYYNKVLKEYGWTTAKHSSLRNRMIRNTPIALRDRIANGLVIRHPSGFQLNTDEASLPPVMPSKRRQVWTKDLSDETVKMMLQFGDRLMSHRVGKSHSVKTKLLSSLTPDEVIAVESNNQEEMNRIEARLMPKHSRHTPRDSKS
jgi:hypothetical protein